MATPRYYVHSLECQTKQWNAALSFLEDTIRTQKNVRRRAAYYYLHYSSMDINTNLSEFKRLVAPHNAYVKMGRLMYWYQYYSVSDRWVDRSFEMVESRLMINLHYNPFVRYQHICYLPYHNSGARYGVEQCIQDEVDILEDVHKLFDTE